MLIKGLRLVNESIYCTPPCVGMGAVLRTILRRWVEGDFAANNVELTTFLRKESPYACNSLKEEELLDKGRKRGYGMFVFEEYL